jgi:hypothetical protein
MNTIVAALLIGACAMARGADSCDPADASCKSENGNRLREFTPPSGVWQSLHASLIPSPRVAVNAAESAWWAMHGGIQATESFQVSGLFRSGPKLGNFASEDEWIWEIRIFNFGEVEGLIWINAHTKAVRVIGRRDWGAREGNSRQPRP